MRTGSYPFLQMAERSLTMVMDFYLDRNARWYGGELFTADDVEFIFDLYE